MALAAVEMTPLPYANDEDRWAAVLERDPHADGRFVYAVTTTGVYCRPTCPSRRPKRENAVFFETATEAERAGYRPCKRCRPAATEEDDPRIRIITQACRTIEQAEEPPSLDALAAAAGLSRFHFHRLFKEVTGVTPKAYGAAHRTQRLQGALTGGSSVTEALYAAGYNASSRFYTDAPRRLGMQPRIFKKGGAGETIRFAVAECTLGPILVAATDKGICSIQFGDDPDALVQDLETRFSKADLVGADPDFESLVATVIGFVEAPGTTLDLPLDIQGTAFQEKVWAALQAIPPGQTASYAEIASAIGSPRAVRAVARACATNPVAVAIPCHRVVRKDGDLSGYRWGVERKRRLIELERRS